MLFLPLDWFSLLEFLALASLTNFEPASLSELNKKEIQAGLDKSIRINAAYATARGGVSTIKLAKGAWADGKIKTKPDKKIGAHFGCSANKGGVISLTGHRYKR